MLEFGLALASAGGKIDQVLESARAMMEETMRATATVMATAMAMAMAIVVLFDVLAWR